MLSGGRVSKCGAYFVELRDEGLHIVVSKFNFR